MCAVAKLGGWARLARCVGATQRRRGQQVWLGVCACLVAGSGLGVSTLDVVSRLGIGSLPFLVEAGGAGGQGRPQSRAEQGFRGAGKEKGGRGQWQLRRLSGLAARGQ
jgi:hypothetical protein